MPSSVATPARHGEGRRRCRRVTISSISAACRGSSGTKPAPMPWILCGPGWPPDSTGAVLRLDGDDPQAGLARLQHLADAGDACRRCRRRRRRRRPRPSVSFQISSAVVRRWIAGLAGFVELLRHDRVRHARRASSSALAMRAASCPARAGVSSSSAPRSASILRRSIDIALRHGQDQPVAARRRRRRPARCRCCPRSARPARLAGLDAARRPPAPRSSPRRCGP